MRKSYLHIGVILEHFFCLRLNCIVVSIVKVTVEPTLFEGAFGCSFSVPEFIGIVNMVDHVCIIALHFGVKTVKGRVVYVLAEHHMIGWLTLKHFDSVTAYLHKLSVLSYGVKALGSILHNRLIYMNYSAMGKGFWIYKLVEKAHKVISRAVV